MSLNTNFHDPNKVPNIQNPVPTYVTPAFQKKTPLQVKTTTAGPSKIEGQKRLSGDITYKPPVSETASTANKCIYNLLSKSGLKKFNTNADTLKTKEGWKGEIAAQVNNLSKSKQESLASLSLYDLVDHDRRVVGHVLSCLSEVEGLDENAKNKLISNISDLNTLIILVEEKEPDFKYLGGGAVNKVYRVNYSDANGQETTGVFKPDPTEMDTITQIKEKHFGTAHASGIPTGDEAHLTARSVGSYALDKILYGDKPIGVKTEYVILNGKRGILMEMAKGASPAPPKMKEREITESELGEKGIHELGVFELLEKDGKNKEVWTKMINKTMGGTDIRVKNGKIYGTFPEFSVEKSSKILVQKDSQINKTVMKFISQRGGYDKLSNADRSFISHQLSCKDFTVENGSLYAIYPETPVNLENPVTAEGLQKLQVFDWISGQVDRHPGNYYIDPENGQVLAIDNDCSFGVNSVPTGIDVRSQPRLGLVVPNNGSLMLRMPDVIMESIKDQIVDLFNQPKIFQETLAQYISPEEIAATLKRLEMLALHVTSDKCKIVATAEELFSPENLLLQDSNNSLYLRERDRYRSKTWNDLRA